MQLVIDIGNSKTKVGYFKGTKLLEKEEVNSLVGLQSIIQKKKPDHIGIGKVGKDKEAILSWLGQNEIDYFLINSDTKIPLKNLYKTPETLGVDRLAAAVGAWYKFLKKAVLVIDLGTCITYDVVNSEAEYLGGGISPGMHLRYKAMSSFTTGLPELEFSKFPPLIGRSTAECMHTGVIHGILYELEKMIEEYKKEVGSLEIVLTGGDSKFFESKLKANIFANQNLILEGLNTILLSNVSAI